MVHIQLEKARPGRRRKNKSLLHRLQAKTYHLPAHITSEEDWQRDVPNVKLSRAFAIVLGIHVVAIGGFMAFELFRHQGTSEEIEQTGRAEPPAGEAPASPAVTASRSAAVTSRVAEPNLDDPANEGLKTYVVGPGETLAAIAGKLNVDERLLAEKNRIGNERPLESGMKLVIPNLQIVAQKPEDVEKLLGERAKLSAAPPAKLIEAKPTAPLIESPATNKAAASDNAVAPPKTIDAPKTVAPSKAVAAPKPAPREAILPAAKRPGAAAAAVPKTTRKEAVAKEEYKPTRRAEPVDEATPIKPNKDPKRLAAPPATLAAAQASRLSTASGSAPMKLAQKKPAKKESAEGTGGGKTASSKAKNRRHVVSEGETAYRIARTYKVDVAALIKANGIKPESLRPGTQLVIPAAVR